MVLRFEEVSFGMLLRARVKMDEGGVYKRRCFVNVVRRINIGRESSTGFLR